MAHKKRGDKAVNIPIEDVSQEKEASAPKSDEQAVGNAVLPVIEPIAPAVPSQEELPIARLVEMGSPASSSGNGGGGLPGVSEDVMAWMEKNPSYRGQEVAYLIDELGASMLAVDHGGNLQQPFKVGDWTYLLVLDKEFPKPAEDGSCVKVYFVSPTSDEVAAVMGMPSAPFATLDANGNPYILFRGFDEELEKYLSGNSSATLSQMAISTARKLHDDYMVKLAEAEAQAAALNRPIITQSKYADARESQGERPNPQCRKVVLSQRAYIQIYNETRARMKTETGGLLVGHFEDGVWYVVEASDPGWNAVFQVSYHEADDDYQNHVCTLMSRTYKHPLAFLGMWHRHPGSLDTFSGTDDGTNSKYVDSCGNGCISALVNYDPDFRLTFYYVERAQGGGVRYSQVDVEVGDGNFANPEMLEIATPEDAEIRIAHEEAQRRAEEKARRTLKIRKQKQPAAAARPQAPTTVVAESQASDAGEMHQVRSHGIAGADGEAASQQGPVIQQRRGLAELIFGIKL